MEKKIELTVIYHVRHINFNSGVVFVKKRVGHLSYELDKEVSMEKCTYSNLSTVLC